MTQPRYVFVYGSLKEDYWNNDTLGNSRLRGTYRTLAPSYNLIDGPFPYLVDGEDHVLGEVYEVVDDEVMRNLDRLEGVAYNHYKHEFMIVTNDEEQLHVLGYKAYDPVYGTSCNLTESFGVPCRHWGEQEPNREYY